MNKPIDTPVQNKIIKIKPGKLDKFMRKSKAKSFKAVVIDEVEISKKERV